MTMLRRARARREASNDSGFTLVEILVAMSVTAVALALLFPILNTVIFVTTSTNSSSSGSAEARLALARLTTDIGSTSTVDLCFPSSALTAPPSTACGGSSGNTLVTLSKVYGTCKWLQWTVSSTGQLTQQSAVVGATAWSSALPLVGPIVNTAAQSVFSYDSSNALMNVQIVLRGANGNATYTTSTAQGSGSQDVDLQTSVSLIGTTHCS